MLIIIIIGFFAKKQVVRHTFLRTHKKALVQSDGSSMFPIVLHVTIVVMLFTAL